jgi:chromate transporter
MAVERMAVRLSAPSLPLAERGIGPAALLRCFVMMGLQGFGGVLPVAMHELVTRRGWLSASEFAEILALCQVVPGPNVVNFGVVFGMRVAGWRGAAACVFGLLVLPVAIAVMLAALYAAFVDVPQVQAAMRAVAAAAAGLVTAVALKLCWAERRNPLVFAGVAAIGVMVLWWRLPVVAIIAVTAPLSLALTWWRLRRDG